MNLVGKNYHPIDNSWCINCRTGRKAFIVPNRPYDELYLGPDKGEEDALFTIVCEPYMESITEPPLEREYDEIFINVQSSTTGNIYRVLFHEQGVI